MRTALLTAAWLVLAFGSFVWIFSAEPPSGIRFHNIADAAGIHARMRCGSAEKRRIPEANGSGAAWLDYDRDGNLDLLIVNGSDIETLKRILAGKIPPPRDGSLYLYRNTGRGLFEDVTLQAGLSNPYWGTGVAVADFNNDGYPDILVTSIGRDLLFRNNRNGTFTEVSQPAGLSRTLAWHTGAAFGDVDGDGKLDLYVAGYVTLDELRLDQPPSVCMYRNVPGFCGPKGLKGAPDILYHNNGDSTFTDVTSGAGVKDSDLRHGFSVVFDDFNQDGRIDIFVANDSDPNYLYLNQGGGKFKEAGLGSGVAFNADGQTQANMGVAVGDYDNDNLLDILTTTFSEDYFPLFHQRAGGFFEDVSALAGLQTATSHWVGWACGFVDFDNDGFQDLWIANGHVYPNAGMLPGTTYHQPLSVFWNRRGMFVRVFEALPGDTRQSYRGGAAGDFLNNGKLGVIVLPIEGTPLLLQNVTSSASHWAGFALSSQSGNRDAIGAQVRIDHCGKTQVASVRNGGSYISVDDPRIHFGLGTCATIDRVSVRWPSGKRQVLEHVAPDRYVEIKERL